ncbi:hypothetical protein C8Q77DRAFT_1135874 [Trametes polyzona]|nr:hypothetical protein C8Q77DRAFT_1135874 [Trametes polyzona]
MTAILACWMCVWPGHGRRAEPCSPCTRRGIIALGGECACRLGVWARAKGAEPNARDWVRWDPWAFRQTSSKCYSPSALWPSLDPTRHELHELCEGSESCSTAKREPWCRSNAGWGEFNCSRLGAYHRDSQSSALLCMQSRPPNGRTTSVEARRLGPAMWSRMQ